MEPRDLDPDHPVDIVDLKDPDHLVPLKDPLDLHENQVLQRRLLVLPKDLPLLGNRDLVLRNQRLDPPRGLVNLLVNQVVAPLRIENREVDRLLMVEPMKVRTEINLRALLLKKYRNQVVGLLEVQVPPEKVRLPKILKMIS